MIISAIKNKLNKRRQVRQSAEKKKREVEIREAIKNDIQESYYSLPKWEYYFIESIRDTDSLELQPFHLYIRMVSLAWKINRDFKYTLEDEYLVGEGTRYHYTETGKLLRETVDSIYTDDYHLYNKETIKQLIEQGLNYNYYNGYFETDLKDEDKSLRNGPIRYGLTYDYQETPQDSFFRVLYIIRCISIETNDITKKEYGLSITLQNITKEQRLRQSLQRKYQQYCGYINGLEEINQEFKYHIEKSYDQTHCEIKQKQERKNSYETQTS